LVSFGDTKWKLGKIAGTVSLETLLGLPSPQAFPERQGRLELAERDQDELGTSATAAILAV